MRFTLKQLEYFLAAAEEGSISNAAKRKRISEASISSAISSLEAEFGIKLFVRKPAQGISITVAGQHLLSEVRRIITDLSRLYDIANELDSEVRGPLSIGCLVTIAPLILPGLLETFEAANPFVRLSFKDLDQAEIIRGLRMAQIDVALTYDMQLPKDVEFVFLAELQPHLVMARDHPLAQHDEIKLTELIDLPYIMLDLPISRRYFASLFKQIDSKPKIAYFSKSEDVVRALVANNYGVTITTILPPCNLALDGRAVTTIPISKDLSALQFGLVMLKQGSPSPPVVTKFVDYCLKQFKEKGPIAKLIGAPVTDL